MQNSECGQCGGCIYRELSEELYRKHKEEDFHRTIYQLKNKTVSFDKPIFISDGKRRRASLAFISDKGKLKLGFNEQSSHNIINIKSCPMLESKLNDILPMLHNFMEEFCSLKITIKNKKKLETYTIKNGTVNLLSADNGIDIVLTIDRQPALEHRLLIADFVNSISEIIIFSWQIKNQKPETIIEKSSPELHVADFQVEIPQNIFLQASKVAENAMINKVLEYLGDTKGKIADLFCGLGTFTYPLAKIKGNNIISADSSAEALDGLQKALNHNQIKNVKVVNRNLFKYPFDETELKGLEAIVMDPPRAGAHEQCREISKLPPASQPKKIIFISCNPKTFIYDA
ncbi:MAG: class I SAM-dependent RNA methyltransferase, partial [Alphaproteobacteria bacterium]|nr:class I SAM-dependent RNA methyltransferase [Alphaproteobacteria bacterium]